MSYATPEDVQTRLGKELTAEEITLVTTRLTDVERMLLRRVDLAAGIAAEEIDVEDVDAVLRLVRNPDGYASETDGTYGYSFSREMASGRLEVLPHEWAVLGVRPGVVQLVPAFTEGPTYPNAHPFTWGG